MSSETYYQIIKIITHYHVTFTESLPYGIVTPEFRLTWTCRKRGVPVCQIAFVLEFSPQSVWHLYAVGTRCQSFRCRLHNYLIAKCMLCSLCCRNKTSGLRLTCTHQSPFWSTLLSSSLNLAKACVISVSALGVSTSQRILKSTDKEVFLIHPKRHSALDAN
jgi:hypothetical protein